MTPRHGLGNRRGQQDGGLVGASNDDHGNPKIVCRIQFGNRVRATGILREEYINGVLVEELAFLRINVRPSGCDHCPALRQRTGGRIDETDQHMSIGPGSEVVQ